MVEIDWAKWILSQKMCYDHQECCGPSSRRQHVVVWLGERGLEPSVHCRYHPTTSTTHSILCCLVMVPCDLRGKVTHYREALSPKHPDLKPRDQMVLWKVCSPETPGDCDLPSWGHLQMVVLMDPMEDPDDILRAHRSREKSYLFDVAFDFTATQVRKFMA